MLNKLFGALTGREPIPAQANQRLELARLILNFRLERDTPYSAYFAKSDFAALHINLLNSAHHAMAIQAGYEIPMNESIKTIQDYIAHFFRYMPEDVPFPFPSHLIPPAVELVTRFYRR